MNDKKQPLIEVYGHGGDVETAAAAFGRQASAFLDYSANINPLGPPQGVITAIQEGMSAVIRYPDPGHRKFKELLAAELGTDPRRILVGNGAAECMALLLMGLSPGTVGVVDPCFSEYRELSLKFGSDIRSVCGHPERDWRADKADVMELIACTDLVFLGQPNNPNGVQYSLEDIREISACAEQEGTWLVLDEAFIDFIPLGDRQTLMPELHDYPRTVIVRSMTKFYAIPGLRLGYTAAHPDVIRKMAGKQVTWSVNGLALLAGEACLGSGRDYEQNTLQLIRAERQKLIHGLRALGLDVTPGEANFLLMELPRPWRADMFQSEMGRRGVLVRSCAMYPGLGERHIRLAVKHAADNDRLLAIMAEVLGISSEDAT
ncbi:threonine-phosphate decarboxylase CobD [Paenibacillus lautus]|uniref:threonine-phosphate decarboxylase CobD n=1 Tax=Paenibacillus lautus TaxID=1401 RepID=UPI003D2B95BE